MASASDLHFEDGIPPFMSNKVFMRRFFFCFVMKIPVLLNDAGFESALSLFRTDIGQAPPPFPTGIPYSSFFVFCILLCIKFE